ncbi:hypothetical protein EWH08_12975 [Sphingobium indicum]|uniref:3-alpha,7-alpha, 12-alpha-trihydroxy-5-beta-cholest-24-enoyl-CoA hydratase n=1 Tax=Sphingobium indicum TaxID=332055 RepID=A0A4Q4J7H3_9SPHN|nr:MaoC/PaaZ C-terminal domain-containing protein [Sphingobium indicum]NYI23560.1 acyl dehydratase [Sphingobium indicum]RYM01580.1 hypothetical protein EWH08_12975 [Sphingobium indicum]
MPLDYDLVKAWPIADMRQRFDVRDTMLYNLGVGAGIPDEDGNVDLRFVWERRLVPVPTMAAVLGEGASWMLDPATTISAGNMVHAEQSVIWHAPLPASGEVIARTAVEEIYDKGADRGAILVTRRTLHEADSDRTLATIRGSVFLREDGGFGGSAIAPKPAFPAPSRPPDRRIAMPTRPEQALIYRLSGDYYPLHVDPEFARRIGFDGTILHGLATYGFAARAIIALAAEGDPERLAQLDVRFSAPVYPGETLEFDLWQVDRSTVAFVCRAGNRVALSNGLAKIRAADC